MIKRDIYIAIMVAAARGNGLNLNPEEVAELSTDSAIETAACNKLTEEEHGRPWGDINPQRHEGHPADARWLKGK
jgi:hypothetical protein